MSGGRKPTHSVKVYDAERDNDRGKYVGVGWSQKDGSIAIKLDAGICLTTVGARIVIYTREERDERPPPRDDERPGRSYA